MVSYSVAASELSNQLDVQHDMTNVFTERCVSSPFSLPIVSTLKSGIALHFTKFIKHWKNKQHPAIVLLSS